MTENMNKRLGFWSLVAIVFGMMVGSGLYNIPQNLAAGAGPLSVGISWLVTGAGMLLLVSTFKLLSDRRPDLDAGIYQYAQECFGNFAGFNVAWGYWLCASFANIAYAVMLNDSFGAFFPILLDHRIPTLIFGSALIWLMFFVVAAGIRTAKLINTSLAFLKIVSLILVIILIILNIEAGTFKMNFEEEFLSGDSLLTQVKSTMLVTLWCFIGIEGAVMMSARAKRSSDVGKASVTGFLISWALYVLVSMLCYGVMSRARLAGLEDPSVAYVLRDICGDWAYYFVIISVIVALLGGWLAWTLVCAQVPYEAAIVKIFPKSFLRLNRYGMPAFGLFVSSVIMQFFLVLVMMADDVYMAALTITGMMVLPAYLSGGTYLWKLSYHPEELKQENKKCLTRYRITGILCTIYCLWMIYAGGIRLFLFTSVFYLAGMGFYVKLLRERKASGIMRLSVSDRVTFAIILLGIIASAIMIAQGNIPF